MVFCWMGVMLDIFIEARAFMVAGARFNEPNSVDAFSSVGFGFTAAVKASRAEAEASRETWPALPSSSSDTMDVDF